MEFVPCNYPDPCLMAFILYLIVSLSSYQLFKLHKELFSFFLFYFIFKLYIIVLVLPNIKMKNYFLKGKVYYWENYQFSLGNKQNWSNWIAIIIFKDFPDGFAGKEFAYNAGDAGVVGSIPGLRRCPRGRNGNPLQDSWEIQVQSLGREDPLEKCMATHSSILAWKIPWTEDPGGL